MKIDSFLCDMSLNVIEVLSKIDYCKYGIVYIVNEKNKLVGAVSDGDVRRWIIETNDLSAKVTSFMNTNPKYVFENEREKAELFRKKFSITSLPVLNNKQEVVDVIVFSSADYSDSKQDLSKNFDVPCIIMAGGKGTRLYPYTKILPKPLIPIGETPILERIFNRFVSFGIKKFYLTVNYKKSMIRSYFEDISPCYSIEYIEESIPLGTAGSIKLITENFNTPVIVANCDSLIDADYIDLYNYHIESKNAITIVSALKNIKVPYGVLKTKENGELVELEEKPILSYFINTGMYIVNPELINLIPVEKAYHMTNLVDDVLYSGHKVGIYPISEDSFLDMGEFGEMSRMEQKLEIL